MFASTLLCELGSDTSINTYPELYVVILWSLSQFISLHEQWNILAPSSHIDSSFLRLACANVPSKSTHHLRSTDILSSSVFLRLGINVVQDRPYIQSDIFITLGLNLQYFQAPEYISMKPIISASTLLLSTFVYEDASFESECSARRVHLMIREFGTKMHFSSQILVFSEMGIWL